MVLIPNSALGVLVGDESSELISLIPGQLAGFPQGLLVLGGNDTVQGSIDSELINGNQGFDQIFGAAVMIPYLEDKMVMSLMVV